MLAVATILGGCGAAHSRPSEPERANPSAFVDDFDGPRLDEDAWNTCHWWDDHGCTIASNEELEWYLPGQVSLADGHLRLEATDRRVTVPGEGTFSYRSGMVTTGPPEHCRRPRYSFTYGTVETRVRMPRGSGLWPALWLLPADCESTPEIDMIEVVGSHPRQASLHLHPADHGEPIGRRYRLPEGTFANRWRTVRLEWEPGRLRWFIDDHKVWTVRGDLVPSEPMYYIANLAVAGDYGGAVGANTRFPAALLLDYVRIDPAGLR